MPASQDEPATMLAAVESAILAGCIQGRTSVRQVAEDCGLSIRTLQRVLEREQTTFTELRRQLLCAEAQRLLVRCDLRIEEVARRVGYADASHFSRAFRQWTGSSPREYRRRYIS